MWLYVGCTPFQMVCFIWLYFCCCCCSWRGQVSHIWNWEAFSINFMLISHVWLINKVTWLTTHDHNQYLPLLSLKPCCVAKQYVIKNSNCELPSNILGFCFVFLFFYFFFLCFMNFFYYYYLFITKSNMFSFL